MNFIRVKYNGKKAYPDRTPLKNRWEPGDEKLIPETYARKGAFALLKFAEFSEVASDAVKADEAPKKDADPSDAEKAAAELAQAQTDLAVSQAKQAEQDQQRENMLLAIGTWDKNALIEYAAKYDTRLDKRLGEANLRQQVSNLVEQFGVR